MRQLNAESCFEVEVLLTGTHRPYRPATHPSYSHGGDPPEYETAEDVEATSLLGLKWNRTVGTGSRFSRVDLLAGLNDEARAIVLANVLAFVGEEEATSELLATVEDVFA